MSEADEDDDLLEDELNDTAITHFNENPFCKSRDQNGSCNNINNINNNNGNFKKIKSVFIHVHVLLIVNGHFCVTKNTRAVCITSLIYCYYF